MVSDLRTTIEEARSILAAPPDYFGTGWPLAVCLLARQALEETVEQYWDRVDQPMNRTSMTHQLLCIPTLEVDAQSLFSLWSRLSEWCHYRAVHAEPTSAELESLLADIENGVASLR